MEISYEIPTMTWIPLCGSHNPLEKTASFPHFIQKYLRSKKGKYNCRQRGIIVDINQWLNYEQWMRCPKKSSTTFDNSSWLHRLFRCRDALLPPGLSP